MLSLLLSFLQNKWIEFFVAVFIKSILVYWALYFVLGIFNRYHVSKTVAKIFGLEFSQELTQEDAEKAKEGYKKLDEQLEVLTSLNKEIAGYISSSFESDLIDNENHKTDENFRIKIKKILQTTYANIKGIEIHVIPADIHEVNKLEEKLASIVEVTWNREDVSTINKKVGVVVYTSIPGLETIIVIDPRSGDYELTDAEIWSIAGLLASMASIVSLAVQFENNP